MAFKYVMPDQPLQGVNYGSYYSQPQQQGVDPGTAMNVAGEFMGGGGGGAVAGTGAAATGTTAAGFGGGGTVAAGGATAGTSLGAAGSTAGGVGGGGAASGGSAIAAGGPWAILAAIIVANEYTSIESGYRSEDTGEYAKDVFTGEVFHQDVEQKWLPMLGIEDDSSMSDWGSVLANPINPMDIHGTVERWQKAFD